MFHLPGIAAFPSALAWRSTIWRSRRGTQTWLGIIDPRIALLLELQRAFGLRFEESAKLDARDAYSA
jgi:hypothetical protein